MEQEPKPIQKEELEKLQQQFEASKLSIDLSEEELAELEKDDLPYHTGQR